MFIMTTTTTTIIIIIINLRETIFESSAQFLTPYLPITPPIFATMIQP
jgi:hypothetical protein